MKLKDYIIKFLGGYTEQDIDALITENIEDCKNALDTGIGTCSSTLLVAAKEKYGMPAEQWCEEMYEAIKSQYDLVVKEDSIFALNEDVL